MSYIVLARKYRPRSFTEMVGQEHVVQALSNALTRQRLHHAYLFTGTRGVGKTTVSRILAKSLNCVGPDGTGGITAAPCGVCNACRDIDAGRYVDYVELDAASNRGVDEISQLLDQSVYKPVVGRFKVYMIDEVHMLTMTAFNAMLKTLEEPPEYLKFVLATTDPQKVPVTVLSRCLQFNLRPMAPQTVQEHLDQVLQAEAVPAEIGALRLLSRAARGSMRDALSLADQAIAFGGGILDEAGVRQMLGAVDRGHVVRIVEALAASDGAALVRTVDELRGLGLSAAGTLEELATFAQQMALVQAVPDAADPTDPDTPAVRALAPLLAPDETQVLYSIALHGRAELALAPDEYSGLMMVLLRLLAFRPQGAAVVATPAAPRVAPPVAVVVKPAPPVVSSRELLRPVAASTRVAVVPAPVPVPVSAPVPVPVPSPAPVAAKPSGLAPWEEGPPADWDEIPLEGDPVPAQTPVRAAESSAPSLEDPLVTRWTALFTELAGRGGINGLVRELAWQAQCLSIDEQATPWRFVLRVERESLRQQGHRDRLQAALSELLAEPVVLDVVAGAVSDSAARRDAARRVQAQNDAEAVITSDPLVAELLARYPTARIVPGSIRPVA
ncbi:DNA polymerase III subunit gamma/tau [Sphaerotilus sp.]|uniref:DNA polymerase III subunit gamma/tau n=1 Tax=Sphaerotilus sp. TaxID=2093942 RepID=UPI00286DF484|nr:DNA polymerase III subunit gamma/tau [Sphaerotilus sp.]